VITVALGPGGEAHRAEIAGLPRTFRLVEGRADVVAVGGLDAAREAIAAGARAVVVADPGAAAARPNAPDPTDLLGPSGALVAIESPVLDPAWRAVVPRLRDEPAELIDSVGPLVDQLALLHDLGDVDVSARLFTSGAHALSGAVAGVPFAVTGAADLRIDLRGHTWQWSVRFGTPTEAVRSDAGGGELVPTDYETVRRATWRDLAAALAEGRAPRFGPAELAAVLSLASGGGADAPPPSGAAPG
jgi:hypothetical protein